MAAFAVFFPLLLSVSSPLAKADMKIPAEYGEVVYQCNAGSPSQLFIIGKGHRDTLTRQNGHMTSRVETQVYQIADWLTRRWGLELLLPEGFFRVRKAPAGKPEMKPAAAECPVPDPKLLEARLADNRTYVNAEMLLKEYLSLRTEQVEDKDLYDAVGAGISKLINCAGNSADYFLLKSELDYLQERRTAAMLQKIPEIVELEFRQESIKNRKAIFTIGLSHLHTIIRYLKEKRISIYPSLFTPDRNKDYVAEPELLKANFGVCVIIPRTLADDQKILEGTKLDKVVSRSRGINE